MTGSFTVTRRAVIAGAVGGELLLEPRFPWEFVQIGNCGSPVEIDEGWLLFTHGVGPMRRYAIGDRTTGLKYGRDGSLEIILSNTEQK